MHKDIENIIVGLDIGTTKIACFIGYRTPNGKIKIMGNGKTESIGVDKGVVTNIENTARSIQKAVKQASDQAGVDVKEVYVGIAGQHIKSKSSSGTIALNKDTIITKANVDELIRTQYNVIALQPGEEIIHVFPQEYTIDDDIITTVPIGAAGARLSGNFHIITGNANNIKNIHWSIKLAGLEVKGLFADKNESDSIVTGFTLEPIASAEAVLSNTEKEAGVVLVDIGGGTTDVAIFYDGIIRHTAVIPMGGNVITNDIKDGCSVMRNQAETLKVRFGSCLAEAVKGDDIIAVPSGIRNKPPREITMKNLAGIIEARMCAILGQVDNQIKESGYREKLIGGIVLTGGGAMLNDVVQLTEYVTGIGSRIGNPNEHLEGDISEELSHPMNATGIGLVIYGLTDTETDGKVEEELNRKKITPIEDEIVEEPVEESVPEKNTPNFRIGEWLTSIFKEDIK